MYLYSNNIGKNHAVHRLVGKAFIFNPDNKPEINHKDGDKENNKVYNLEWATSKENTCHKINVLGKHYKGVRHHNYGKEMPKDVRCKISKVLKGVYVGSKHSQAILNEITVKEIKLLLANNFTQRVIADRYAVNYRTINKIKLGKSWTHVRV